MAAHLPLMKRLLTPLAKSVFLPFGSLEKSGFLIKRISETIENEAKE